MFACVCSDFYLLSISCEDISHALNKRFAHMLDLNIYRLLALFLPFEPNGIRFQLYSRLSLLPRGDSFRVTPRYSTSISSHRIYPDRRFAFAIIVDASQKAIDLPFAK